MMKFILVVLLISLSIVFAGESPVSKKSVDLLPSNVKRDNITLPETCQCYITDSNGKETIFACSKDEANNNYCPEQALQKRGPGHHDDDDEGNQRRPGHQDHDDDDDDDEWRHNRPGYNGRPDRPERPRLPNLIKNGGFENGFTEWRRLGLNGNWEIQTRAEGDVQQFFSELDIPVPPEGKNTAMVASRTGANIVVLSQIVDLAQFSQCTAIQFELSFRYFYRNYANDFDITPLSLQYFQASINRVNNYLFPLHTAYITTPGLPDTTGNKYLRHKSEFLVSTGINAVPLTRFELVFSQVSSVRLRVGIDDVQLTGRCRNF